MGFPNLPCYGNQGLDLGFPNCLTFKPRLVGQLCGDFHSYNVLPIADIWSQAVTGLKVPCAHRLFLPFAQMFQFEKVWLG